MIGAAKRFQPIAKRGDMKIQVDWYEPVTLRKDRKSGGLYTLELENLPAVPGIYVFARKWGADYEALYVGQSQNIRHRIRTHLNNLRLMRHLEDSKTGRRVVFAGSVIARRGQKRSKLLSLLERSFIRHFLAEGHDLVNQQGIRIRRHEIHSEGSLPKSFVPPLMYLEKTKGD
ncbi:MAG: GIY-YIG nuclease family protein [Gammaproteobacteria bacterium]|nr:GIY-YIG nuclease family protein [Gammaproteobacteria bacterium]